MSVSEQLERALAAAEKRGESRYLIAREAKVNYAVLARFLNEGTDIKLSTVDRLAEYLGLELRPKPKRRT